MWIWGPLAPTGEEAGLGHAQALRQRAAGQEGQPVARVSPLPQ